MNTTPSEAQDHADMARLQQGDDDALNQLMERHSTRLFHYLIRVLRDEAEAADLAQESFVRVFQYRGRFNPHNKFSTWLYTIATNLARDRLRWLSRHPRVSLEHDGTEQTGLQHVLPSNHPTPRESLEAEERAAAVRDAVAGLPEDLRVPLILSEYEERSHAEIASVLNCSTKAVEMRVYRARQLLRDRLASLLQAI